MAAIITGHDAEVRRVRAQVEALIRGRWGLLRSWRAPDIDRFATSIAPVVTASQRHVGNLMAVYLAAVETARLGTPARPRPVPSTLTTDLRGVPTVDVYRRSGDAVWTALANGADLPDAVDQGLARSLSMAATDLQLARTNTAQGLLSTDERVSGYLRVPDGPNPCELCLTASTNFYHSSDLLPIHNNCFCGVEPVYGGSYSDSRDQFTSELTALQDAGITSSPSDPVDVVVHQHGEIGPVLALAGQHFSGPGDF